MHAITRSHVDKRFEPARHENVTIRRTAVLNATLIKPSQTTASPAKVNASTESADVPFHGFTSVCMHSFVSVARTATQDFLCKPAFWTEDQTTYSPSTSCQHDRSAGRRNAESACSRHARAHNIHQRSQCQRHRQEYKHRSATNPCRRNASKRSVFLGVLAVFADMY